MVLGVEVAHLVVLVGILVRVSAPIAEVTLPAQVVMAHSSVVSVVAENVITVFPLGLGLNYGDFAGMSVGAVDPAGTLVA